MGDEGHDIGWAIRKLRTQVAVRRTGWFDECAHLVFVPEEYTTITKGVMVARACILLRSPRVSGAGITVTPYTATQEDILAEDWELAPKRSSIVAPRKELII